MFRFRNRTTCPLDERIAVVHETMDHMGPAHEEYAAMLAYLERLTELKAKKSRDKVSRDTLAIVAGNLAGILVIVAYEQKHAFTSKGLREILRPKMD